MNHKPRLHPGSSLRPPAVSRLEAHVGYWLRGVSNQLSQALSRGLEDKGVTLAEWIVLRELYEGDLRPSTLAERLGLTRGAISKLARRLVGKLMITQQAGTGDGRAQMLALTGTGRAIVVVLAGHLDAIDEEFFGDLDPGTRALLLSALREIVRRRGLKNALPAD
jgi:DNA-binding MarR family transcriptional regulator